MRGPACALVSLALVGACHEKAPPDAVALGRRYADDAAFRRRVLVASLVNPDNIYSKVRLDRYREDVWGALPEWNPPVAAVAAGVDGKAELDPPASSYRALDVDAVPWEHDALVALGREAFFGYPVQMQDALRTGLMRPEAYGLWQTPRSLGGVVLEKVSVGGPRLAMTCATCHASPDAHGEPVAGRPNASLDLGAMLADTYRSEAPRPVWGKGRLDVTSDDGLDNPVAISDLRPIRWEKYLHHDATVRNGLIELAIRIETLIITSNKWALRPPRKVAFALALYLWELRPVPVAAPSAASERGASIFDRECAYCHQPPAYNGGRIALATIGTDPAIGISPDRTTGTYRVPSLLGVGDRAPLLACGKIGSLEALFDPGRKEPGHRYGLELSPGARGDLIAFLRTLH